MSFSWTQNLWWGCEICKFFLSNSAVYDPNQLISFSPCRYGLKSKFLPKNNHLNFSADVSRQQLTKCGGNFLVKTWILNYTWMTQKESADLVEQQQSYSIQQDPTFPISCTFQLNLHRNGWHLVIKVCKCFIDVLNYLEPKFHPILMSGLGDIPDFAYKWRKLMHTVIFSMLYTSPYHKVFVHWMPWPCVPKQWVSQKLRCLL